MDKIGSITLTILSLIVLDQLGLRAFSLSLQDSYPKISKRYDIPLQTCVQNFDIHKDTIIRTQDSKRMGAENLSVRDVLNRDECLRLCCETNRCNVFIYEEKKTPGSCYLFDCGPPGDFRCKFTRHQSYTSGVLSINRRLVELENEMRQANTNLRLGLEATVSPAAQNSQSQNLPVNPPAAPASAPAAQGCVHYQFQCQRTPTIECIAIYNVCDGIPQCSDGSDERAELNCSGAAGTPATSLSLASQNLPVLSPGLATARDGGATGLGRPEPKPSLSIDTAMQHKIEDNPPDSHIHAQELMELRDQHYQQRQQIQQALSPLAAFTPFRDWQQSQQMPRIPGQGLGLQTQVNSFPRESSASQPEQPVILSPQLIANSQSIPQRHLPSDQIQVQAPASLAGPGGGGGGGPGGPGAPGPPQQALLPQSQPPQIQAQPAMPIFPNSQLQQQQQVQDTSASALAAALQQQQAALQQQVSQRGPGSIARDDGYAPGFRPAPQWDPGAYQDQQNPYHGAERSHIFTHKSGVLDPAPDGQRFHSQSRTAINAQPKRPYLDEVQAGSVSYDSANSLYGQSRHGQLDDYGPGHLSVNARAPGFSPQYGAGPDYYYEDGGSEGPRYHPRTQNGLLRGLVQPLNSGGNDSPAPAPAPAPAQANSPPRLDTDLNAEPYDKTDPIKHFPQKQNTQQNSPAVAGHEQPLASVPAGAPAQNQSAPNRPPNPPPKPTIQSTDQPNVESKIQITTLAVVPTSTSAPKVTTISSKNHSTHGSVSHSKKTDLLVDMNNLEQETPFEMDGKTVSPKGAVISLTLGLVITGILIVLSCRVRLIKQRLIRRGGKSPYAHDADYLVNGMYL